jgi:hypothetical protein
MLESPMRCTGIQEVRHAKLMNMAQPLERTRVQNTAFIGIQMHEHVNGVADLVVALGHMNLRLTRFEATSGSLEADRDTMEDSRV